MSDLRERMAANATQPSTDNSSVFRFSTPGETVCGDVIVAKFDIVTKYGDADLIEVSDAKRGQVTVWLTNAQLRAGLVDGHNQLGRRIRVGDTVFIRLDGTTDLEDGKTVKDYSIALEEGTVSPDAGIAEPKSEAVGVEVPF